MACAAIGLAAVARKVVAERLKRSVIGRFMLDAQTEVDGQLAGDLPVVLDVDAEVLVLLGEAAAAGHAAARMPSSSDTSSPPTGGAGELSSGPVPQVLLKLRIGASSRRVAVAEYAIDAELGTEAQAVVALHPGEVAD